MKRSLARLRDNRQIAVKSRDRPKDHPRDTRRDRLVLVFDETRRGRADGLPLALQTTRAKNIFARLAMRFPDDSANAQIKPRLIRDSEAALCADLSPTYLEDSRFV